MLLPFCLDDGSGWKCTAGFMMLVYRILFYSFEYEVDQAKLHEEVEDLAKGMFWASATAP